MDCVRCATLLILAVTATCVQAEGYGDTDNGLRYGGQFVGNCDGDGMYFNDMNSYVMCSHSIAYIMPCAPGSRNSGRQLESLSSGDSVGFTAFCDVNLVDIGYAAFHSAQNTGFGGSGGNSGYGGTGGGNSGYGGTGGGNSGYGGTGGNSGYGGSGGNSGYGGSSKKVTSGGYGRQNTGYGTGGGSKVQIVLSGSYQKPKSSGYSQPKPQPRYAVQSYSQQQPSYGQKMSYGSNQGSNIFIQPRSTGYSTGLKNFNRVGGNTYQSFNAGGKYQ